MNNADVCDFEMALQLQRRASDVSVPLLIDTGVGLCCFVWRRNQPKGTEKTYFALVRLSLAQD